MLFIETSSETCLFSRRSIEKHMRTTAEEATTRSRRRGVGRGRGQSEDWTRLHVAFATADGSDDAADDDNDKHRGGSVFDVDVGADNNDDGDNNGITLLLPRPTAETVVALAAIVEEGVVLSGACLFPVLSLSGRKKREAGCS